jgi:hypothetical protein
MALQRHRAGPALSNSIWIFLGLVSLSLLFVIRIQLRTANYTGYHITLQHSR